jgi:hypothetical protein
MYDITTAIKVNDIIYVKLIHAREIRDKLNKAEERVIELEKQLSEAKQNAIKDVLCDIEEYLDSKIGEKKDD